MFNDILQALSDKTPGALGAVLMGYDGIAIAATGFAAGETLDIQMIAIEYANVLKEIRNAAAVLAIGELEEVDIQTRRYRFVIRAITDEYFVALTLSKDGNVGKGRYLLRRDAELFREALQ